MVNTINDRSGYTKPDVAVKAATPPKPQPVKEAVPNVAQFAINQTLKTAQANRSLGSDLNRLSVFKDFSSGQYVSIIRNENGEVVEQIPDEKALEFYARLERELNKESIAIEKPVSFDV